MKNESRNIDMIAMVYGTHLDDINDKYYACSHKLNVISYNPEAIGAVVQETQGWLASSDTDSSAIITETENVSDIINLASVYTPYEEPLKTA